MRTFLKKFRAILLILMVLAAAYLLYTWMQAKEAEEGGSSGTIQAVEVNLAFELGGQIAAVHIQEGDRVRAGDVLVQLEAKALQAELKRADAALAQAESETRLLAASPLVEQRQVAISNAQVELVQAQQALEKLVENADSDRAKALQAVEQAENELEDLLVSNIQRASALAAIASAEKAVDQARRNLTILTTPPSQAVIDQAYANQLLAEQEMNDTLADIALAEQKLKGGLGPYVPQQYVNDFKKQMRGLIQNLEIKLSQDQLKHQNILERYNNLLAPVDVVELALAEAALARAEAELGQAQRDYERVKEGPSPADTAVLEARIANLKRGYIAQAEGPDPDDLALAQARIRRAAANLSLAEANTIEEQLDAAQAGVDSARAAQSVIRAQLDKLVLRAPVDGTVLERRVEAGEVVRPGTEVITLGLLDELILRVYLPKERYGSIHPGDEVRVRADSFPGQPFVAVVSEVAAETDFIPRNVEMANGQVEPVFEVVLTLRDPRGMLRPGMQAGVLFEQP